ncbi:MAG: hypothetical protein HS104_24395 [Polyangiaceae bacterium]|nr:hypothetical protein [Polyangiaceae bacterium]MCL4754281.1 hypothetical protein [Myxococcales bacterium]
MDTGEMLERLIPLFEEGGRFHGRYRLSGEPDQAPTEIVPNAIWEVPIFPEGAATCDLLRVYGFDTTAGPLLHAHWRNETRALLRLSTRGHRALPRLREAEYIHGLELGYLIVADSGVELAEQQDLLEALGADRKRAFLAYFAIVEAVAAMHEEGLLHRNLSLQALRVADEQGSLVVDGFQMSSFVSAWFRPRPDMRTPALAPTEVTSRWMLAPERLAVVEGLPAQDVETYATDVFSLGMVGIALLAGPLAPPHETYSPEAHRRWAEERRTQLRQAQLPTTLERLLDAMTATDRRNRVPSGVAAHDLLSTAYGAILGDLEWRAGDEAPAYELLYLSESIDRLYTDGRAQSHPSDPDFREYNELIENDLARAVLAWAPDGFEPWERRGDRAIAAAAKVVLLGRAYAYFCQHLDHNRPGEDRARLVVKHMLPVDRAGVLRRAPRQRAAPRVMCSYLSAVPARGRRPARPAGTGAWSDLVPTVQYDGGRSVQDPVLATARWLVDVQRADLRRRWFSVTREHEQGDLIFLRAVETPPTASDDAQGAFDRLWATVSPQEPMGQVFGDLARRAAEADESLKFWLKLQPGDREPIARLQFERVLDPYACAFRVESAVLGLPDAGWLMPDDTGTLSNLSRQTDAIHEVEQRYGHLAAQVRSPRAVRIPSQLAPSTITADDTQQLLERIHETWPIFALQGPPGTGKTYTAVELVRRLVAEDPFARVLVSAQSHHALDNLLEGVIDRVDGLSALRIASAGTIDSVSPRARDYLLASRAAMLLREISEAKTPHGRMRSLVSEWRNRASSGDVELRADFLRRLPRASSLVFATSGQATHEALGSSRGASSFDWVIIEEAARGWITEFFIPMVHGARWCLVGDHAQLKAHRQDELERLLQRDIDDQITAEAVGARPTPEWRRYLRHFDHLMTVATGRRDPPRGALRVQRRMHPDIAGLISEAFYPDLGIETADEVRHEREHGITVAPYSGTALVWIDTSSLKENSYENSDGGLMNLCEWRAIDYFFRNRVGTVRAFDARIPSLAVLSPYKRQRRLLEEKLGLEEGTVRTVDSYQGRQAEVVVVSLVRSNPIEETSKAIGFLDDPSRVNVMFSRARRLLIVVGCLEHFAGHGKGTFWEAVVTYFRSERRFVIDAAAAGFRHVRGRA